MSHRERVLKIIAQRIRNWIASIQYRHQELVYKETAFALSALRMLDHSIYHTPQNARGRPAELDRTGMI